jgi:hypothetical protein
MMSPAPVRDGVAAIAYLLALADALVADYGRSLAAVRPCGGP